MTLRILQFNETLQSNWIRVSVKNVNSGIADSMTASRSGTSIPGKDPKSMKSAQLVYAGDIHMMHGEDLGASFYGTVRNYLFNV